MFGMNINKDGKVKRLFDTAPGLKGDDASEPYINFIVLLRSGRILEFRATEFDESDDFITFSDANRDENEEVIKVSIKNMEAFWDAQSTIKVIKSEV